MAKDKEQSQKKKGGEKGEKKPAGPPEPKITPRLKTLYDEQIMAKVMKQFKLENKHQAPRLTKIVVNCGVGRYLENQKLKPEVRDAVIDTLTTITGQRPVMRMAKKSVANFKVREGAPSGVMVTLRRERMWHFLDRLIHLAIPRFKDFRGVKATSFDPGGSYSMGISEQAVWPEINIAKMTFTHGMHITMVFEHSNPAMSRFVLTELGMPFVKSEEAAAA